jgi:hypothetical protein
VISFFALLEKSFFCAKKFILQRWRKASPWKSHKLPKRRVWNHFQLQTLQMMILLLHKDVLEY